MNFPQNLKYTNEHEWIRVEGDIAYVGITDYAQEQLQSQKLPCKPSLQLPR